jgi:hypothetical protein
LEVNIAVLADAANVSQEGKLNITGIFNRLQLKNFPATSPTFSIVLGLLAHASEVGNHQLLVRLADEDGQEIAKIKGDFKVPRAKSGGKPIGTSIILGTQVKLPKPGDFSFDVLIDGRWEKTISLEVLKADA